MTPIHPGLLLLPVLLSLMSGAQAQPVPPEQPCPDCLPNPVGEANVKRQAESLEKLQATCMPQLEEASRTFLKTALPTTEVTLTLSKNGGGAISPDKPYTAYMDVECVNKDVCDNTTLTLELPPQSQPSRCTPTQLSLRGLEWSGVELWSELKKGNPRVKLHPGSARVVGIKAKSLRLQELLKRLRADGEFDVEDGPEVPCAIQLTSTEASCIPIKLYSKETGDIERSITFDIVKKQGRWQVKPGSMTFQ